MLLKRQSDKVRRLAKVPLFAGLSQRELSLIARDADEVQVEEGTVLTRQGGVAREFMLILRGSARVERNRRQIARLREGDFFGEMSLLDGRPRSATVVAERTVDLLVVPSREFSALLYDAPGLTRKLLGVLSERLRKADEELSLRN